jgi:glycerol-3-phosphate acyltransferase PlsX
MIIALDALGGDRAPREPIAGAVQAVRQFGLEIAVVGPRPLIEDELARHGALPAGLHVVEASQAIGMDESPAQAVRQKRDATINVAMRLLKDGEVSAVVSAGNTGAVVASALLNVGRLAGIERPAIGTIFPSTEHGVLLLDCGANAAAKASYMVQFGYMGTAFMEKAFGIERPRVGLLNIGEEEGKGNELVQEVYDKLKKTPLNFIGNVEGKDITAGIVDVVVTDGFTGNVLVKASEALLDFAFGRVRSVVESKLQYRIAGLFLRDALREMRRKLEYAEYGGVPLLGVNGVVIVAHGRADAIAFTSALRAAQEMASSGLLAAMTGIPKK